MHARIGYSTVEPGSADVARKTIEEEILPRVRRMRGVSAGYWLEPKDGEAMAIVVFTDEDHAKQPIPNAQPGEHPAPGVTVDRVEIREVMGRF